MTKRLFSLMLAAVLVLGLFAGMSVPASAEDDIGNLFNRYFTEENFDELFSGTPVQTGSCEKEGSNPVFYQIYKVEPEKIRELVSDSSIGTQNEIFDKLRKQFPDFNINGTNLLGDLNFDFLLGDMDYYALKIYGSGEMKDYTMTSRAPWSGHITIDDTDVNMENQIIAAYVTDGVKNIGNQRLLRHGRADAGLSRQHRDCDRREGVRDLRPSVRDQLPLEPQDARTPRVLRLRLSDVRAHGRLHEADGDPRPRLLHLQPPDGHHLPEQHHEHRQIRLRVGPLARHE